MKGSTPLHVACKKNKEEIALFLINTERDRVRQGREGRCWQGGAGGGRGRVPSYNMENSRGWRPVFTTSSVRIVEEFLSLDDLDVADRDGRPLLWHCAERGCVSERVATDVKLAGQFSQRWNGTLPLEKGEHHWCCATD